VPAVIARLLHSIFHPLKIGETKITVLLQNNVNIQGAKGCGMYASEKTEV